MIINYNFAPILIVIWSSARSTSSPLPPLFLHQMDWNYYSADSDAVAAARSLQTFTIMYTSMATFWMYDYACSFHEESIFLLGCRWSRVKALYILTRYMPFLLFAVHLYTNFIPDETPDRCQFVNNICSTFSFMSIVCSEFFFILRTYALWNNNKVVLAVMLSTFAALLVGSSVAIFSATATAPFATSSIPGITGCYQSSGSASLFVPFLLLFVLELMLISLTLTCALRSWRTHPSRLYVVLLKHNVFYYACGLVFSALNVLTSLLLEYAYSGMFNDFQIVIHAILATRMHLRLWHENHQSHEPW
ncbi:hypothetical protein K503DRAFT_119287 [Rhizopogon vinicolor AM-OR11-026]|uniref:DUF6533 domain-containing protein n=1 Tax=Rhizopogon vinicolor AM-OR11-026 TaxID=1314800 RepID=A0A1B7N297_9AGAM|nr:hypothetical protein K503DRAFT_119287 [Rhizopogon vinicolor AM-OR11-026]